MIGKSVELKIATRDIYYFPQPSEQDIVMIIKTRNLYPIKYGINLVNSFRRAL